jgi:predicted RNase H-like nuclease (RuvC/YqgF family)
MKKDDLTKVRYIGSARMKLLYESGITTFKQLFETPLGKLAQVKNIGKHYAKQIKDAVAEVYAPPVRKVPEKSKDVDKKKPADVKKKPAKPNQKLQKKIKKVNKGRKQINLKAKALGKKNQDLLVEIETRSKKLKQHAGELSQLEKKLTKKVSKELNNKADNVIAILKKMGKKPKKKVYKALSEELKSLNKALRKSIPG